MRILIDGRPLLDAHPTGVSRFASHLLDALFALPESSKHEFVVYSNSASGAMTTRAPRWKIPHVRTIHTRIPNKLLHTSIVATGYPSIDWIAQRAGSGPIDAVVALNPHFLRVTSSVPLFITIHDVSMAIAPDLFSPKARLWHRAIRLSQLVRSATHVFTVSESTRADVHQHFGIPHERCTTITPAAPPTVTHVCSSQCPFLSPNPKILMIGTREKRKNILGALIAFKEVLHTIPNAELILIGGEGYGWNEAQQFLNKHTSVAQRVHILGFVDDTIKAAALAHATVCVYPSWYEGFGIPILEAFTAGIPVVTSYGSALAETARDAALFTVPWRPDMLAHALHTALTDQQVRATLTQRGKQRVQAFSWENSARTLLTTVCTYAHRH